MKSSEFNILLLPFSSRMYRLAFGLVGNREEAEDAVQEVFLKLWKMRDNLAEYNSLEALCIRVTRNHCLDVLRKRKHAREAKGELEKVEDHSEENDPASELLEKERSMILEKLINELPEPQRSLVYYRHISGKEYHEIEKLMDMKENAIRVSISRARKQLKKMLQNQYASWII